MKTIKVGDEVVWRGCFGEAAPQLATIKTIDLCERPNMKYGVDVKEAFVFDLPRCCVSLTNGSWAYGYQISAK